MAIQQRNTSQAINSDIQKQHDGQGRDTDRLLPNQSEKLILSWNEIPAWMQDNVYITGGYRRQTNNYWDCVKSLGYLHNESGTYIGMVYGKARALNVAFAVNIWSHLLTFILFVGFGIHFLWTQPFQETLTTFDITYFFLFIAGALLCLGFSASFHCFSCHSEKVAATWNRCDYAGITCLIV